MKILVLNGSPRGKNSVTLQSVRYLQKHFPQVEFTVFQVGQRIKAIERDIALFDSIMEAAGESDCILWIYPVYTFLVPYQLMKFIDLVFERGREDAFRGKYTTQLSTSKHFYDYTAYNYIHQISEDLGMKHLHGHCADMDDLTIEAGRQRLRTFGAETIRAVEQELPVTRKYLPVAEESREYVPAAVSPASRVIATQAGTTLEKGATERNAAPRIVLITDCSRGDTNLGRMIEVYRRKLPHTLEVLHIGEFPFQGGCLGCFQCAFEGKCAYKDGFEDVHRRLVLEADCIIMAASVGRHWFNPIWKCYDDRQFYNGHRSVMMGKSIGYIISGPLRQEPNLREVLEARSEVAGLYLLDIVTDEYDSDEEITALLTNLAQKTAWAMEERPARPKSYLGVGGQKVFRDLIWVMRGLMQEDHRFYKAHGVYDFPQKQWKRILQMQLIGLLMKWPAVRKRAAGTMSDMMVKPYSDAVEKY